MISFRKEDSRMAIDFTIKNDDIVWTDVLSEFIAFLKACGYSICFDNDEVVEKLWSLHLDNFHQKRENKNKKGTK